MSVSQSWGVTTRTVPKRDSSAGRSSAALPTTTIATAFGSGIQRAAAALAMAGVTAATRDS